MSSCCPLVDNGWRPLHISYHRDGHVNDDQLVFYGSKKHLPLRVVEHYEVMNEYLIIPYHLHITEEV